MNVFKLYFSKTSQGGLAIRMVLDKSTISNFEKKKYNFFTYLLNNCDRICCCTSTNFKVFFKDLICESVIRPIV